MPLDGFGFEEFEKTQPILKNLDLDRLPVDLEDTYAGLSYLNQLLNDRQSADRTELDEARLALYDLSYQLREQSLEGFTETHLAWKAEKFEEAISEIARSLPEDLTEALFAPLTGPTSVVEELGTPSISLSIPQKLIPRIDFKQKLTGKNLIRALSVCAALTLTSDEKQWPLGPETMARSPQMSQPEINTSTNLTVTTTTDRVETVLAPQALQIPEPEAPFELLRQAAFPTEVVAEQTPHIAQRLQFVLNTPDRRALFEDLRGNPNYRHDIALLGLIESNLNPNAISHSGAMGILQDMGRLQGAFGDPRTVNDLARADLLPTIENPRYNRIIGVLKRNPESNNTALLDFLIEQRDASTEFYQAFVAAQRPLLTDPETSAHIADLYLTNLTTKALAQLPINDDPLEALNFAVMSYNLGMGHLHTLRRVMAQNEVTDFNTHTVLSFMARSDFESILNAHNLGRLHNNYLEARDYLSRYIALQAILHHNDSRV